MALAIRSKLAQAFAHAADDEWFHLLFGFALPAACYLLFINYLATFTIDDAYISFRYARNLADGHGLVYNIGEHVEGYTNFLWTVLLAIAMKFGGEPTVVAKILGSSCAVGTMAVVFGLSRRLARQAGNPRVLCLATWMMATSINFVTHTFLGLEGGLFLFLMTGGLALMLRETEDQPAAKFPWSGLVFGLAALTRPEAPAYFAVIVPCLFRRPFATRKQMTIVATFVAVVATQYLWRHAYYGAWLPNTLAAKTGDLRTQFNSGLHYLTAFSSDGGMLIALVIVGIGLAAAPDGRRPLLALVAVTLFSVVYIALIGADWMPKWRYLLPVEPFAYLLADQAINRMTTVEGRIRRPLLAGLAALVVVGIAQRGALIPNHFHELAGSEKGWRSHEGRAARWFAAHGDGKSIAIGDIGEVGYRSNQPIFDMLGLVTPAVGRLPGGYAAKNEKMFGHAFYDAKPAWLVTITNDGNCDHAAFPLMRTIINAPYGDFFRHYDLAHAVRIDKTSFWCLIKRREFDETNLATLFDFEAPGYPGWTVTGTAFGSGPARGMNNGQQIVGGFRGRGLVNSYLADVGDPATGRMVSQEFLLDRSHLALRVGGGANFDTRVELSVDGQRVAAAFGEDSEDLRRVVWDVSEWRGRMARLSIVDERTSGWGHILVDDVEAFDVGVPRIAREGLSETDATIEKALPVKEGPAEKVREKVTLSR